MLNLSSYKTVWCKIPLKQDDRLLVGTVYRSPNRNVANNAELNEFLSRGG